MTDQFYNILGLCRKAKRLCIGHDEVKESLRRKKAKLLILANDASERLENEMRGLAEDVSIYRTDASMDDMQARIGKRSGIFSVTDDGFKNLVLSTIREDSDNGK